MRQFADLLETAVLYDSKPLLLLFEVQATAPAV
jgi:hypothetical protein